MMAVRGIRGAITVDRDAADAIVEATGQLLVAMVEANGARPDELAAAFFTTTPDLTAEFPAAAARLLGWETLPMLCGHEMAVPGRNARALPRCIRVLLLWNTEREAAAVQSVYLRGAHVLRAAGAS